MASRSGHVVRRVHSEHPLLVQLFFIYFGLSQVDIQVPNYFAGLIGLV